jgi:hypothetical protein
VAETHGLFEHKVADFAMLQVVDIGTTDTSLADLYQDLVVGDFGNRALQVSGFATTTHIFNLDILNTVEDKAWVVAGNLDHFDC